MNARKRILAGFLTLAMLLSLLTGMTVPAWAVEGEAEAPELSMWSPTDVTVTGVDGQEYVIVPKGSEPDWSKALEPEDGFVTFEDLTPATAYVIYTRLKDGTGEPKTKELTTDLAGIGVFSESDYVPGAVFTVQPDPEDTQGLTYQWYYDTISTNEYGGELHDLTPIDGATDAIYTIQEKDLGQYLAVKAFKDGTEVGEINELGPVSEEGTPAEDETCPQDDTCPISQFTDAQPDAWYHDGVHWALDAGLMNGVGKDQFAPNGTATRAMVVTMLWRLEGEPAGKAPAFDDVKAGIWYAQPVGWAAENGIVTGTTSATFAPDSPVSREQLATILYRYAQQKGQGFTGAWAFLLDYPDAETVSEWAYEPLCWMTMNGIITGMGDGSLAPRDNATRAQIATMFQRFVEAGMEERSQDDLYLTLVNKTHKLPDNWEDRIELLEMKNAYDEDIRVEKGSYEAFLALREDLLQDGVDIELDSCYRSVARQEELWAEFEKEYGLDYCKQYVAVPGFSEHHTGFAVDVCLIKDGQLIYENDEMMKETAIWEKVHAKLPEYGFILRYMEGKEDITGYAYEPWHLRYVGDPAIAQAITERGITLEEYLNQVEPADATVDYGTSDIYTREDMKEAISLIRAEFGTWEGCELHSILYAGDACNSADNIQWMNELKEGQGYTQCIEFLSDFHSPTEEADLKESAWEADQEYTDWQWYLARSEGGSWELLTWGY